jgi:CPA1 family monovalent cation:H+ antiporter
MQTVIHDLPTKLAVLETSVLRASNASSEDAAIFRSCRGFRTGPTSLFTVLLFPLLAVLFSYFIRGTFVRYRLTLPYTVPLVLLGGVFGVAGCYLPLGELSQSLRQWVSLNEPTVLYYILFPPILFESAMYLDWWVVKHTIPHQFALSIILVFISAAIIAAFTTYVFGTDGWSFNAGWVFGALISPTDALAVALTLAQTPVRKHIQVVIQGEALFNDGSGFTLFIVFLSRLMPNPNLSIGYIFEQFFRLAGGGILVGVGMAIPTLLLLRLVWRDAAIEIGGTLVMAYLTFYVADGPCGVSGIVAVSAFGVMFSADRIASITPAFQESLDAFWEAISHIINSIAFVYAGFISVVNLIVFWGKSGVDAAAIGYGVALYPITYLCRVVAVIALYPILRAGRYGASWREAILIVHCGLRGAISLIAAQIVFHTPSIQGSTVVSARVQLWTSMVVLLTLLFQGTSVRQVAAWLGLLRETAAEVRSFRLQVRRLHRQAKTALREMQKQSRFIHANWRFVEDAALLPYKLDELLLSAGRVRSRIRQLASRHAKAETHTEPITLTAAPSEQVLSAASTNGRLASEQGTGTWQRSSDDAEKPPASTPTLGRPHHDASIPGNDEGDESSLPSIAPIPSLEAIQPRFLDMTTHTNDSSKNTETLLSVDQALTRFPLERKLSQSVLYSRQLAESRRRTLLAVRANIHKQHLIGSISRVAFRLLDAVIDHVNDQVCLQGRQADIRLFENSQQAGWGLTRWERLGIKLLGRIRFLDRIALAILHRRLFIGYDVLSGLAVALVQAWRSRYAECSRALESLRALEKMMEPRPPAATLLTMILHADAQVLDELERDLQSCEAHLRSMRILSLETVRSCESLRAAAVMLSRQERILDAMYAEGLLTKREFRGLVDQIDMRREALQRVSVRFPPPSFERSIEAGIRRWFLPSSSRDGPPFDGESASSSLTKDGAPGIQHQGQTHSLSPEDPGQRLYAVLRRAGQVRTVLSGERLEASHRGADAVMLVARGVLELRWPWTNTPWRFSANAPVDGRPQDGSRPSSVVSSRVVGQSWDDAHPRRSTAWTIDLEAGSRRSATPVSGSSTGPLGAAQPQTERCPVSIETEQAEIASSESSPVDMPMTQVIARLISRDHRQVEADLASIDTRLRAAAATFAGEWTGEPTSNAASMKQGDTEPSSWLRRLWERVKGLFRRRRRRPSASQYRPEGDVSRQSGVLDARQPEEQETVSASSAGSYVARQHVWQNNIPAPAERTIPGATVRSQDSGRATRPPTVQTTARTASSPSEDATDDLVAEWEDDTEALDSEAMGGSVSSDARGSIQANGHAGVASAPQRATQEPMTHRVTAWHPSPAYEVVSLLRHDDPLRNVHGIGQALFHHSYPYELVVASEMATVLLIPQTAFRQIMAAEAVWYREGLRLAAAEVVDALIPGLETFFNELYRINAVTETRQPARKTGAELASFGSSCSPNVLHGDCLPEAGAEQALAPARPPMSSTGSGPEAAQREALGPDAQPSPRTTVIRSKERRLIAAKLPPRQDSFTMYDYYQRNEQQERWWADASRSADRQAFLRYQVYVTGALAWYGLYECSYQIRRGSFRNNQCLLSATPSMILILLAGALELRPTSLVGAQAICEAFMPGRNPCLSGDESAHSTDLTGAKTASAQRQRRHWQAVPPGNDGVPPAKLMLLSASDIPSLMCFLNDREAPTATTRPSASGASSVSSAAAAPTDWRTCSCRLMAPAVLRLDHLAAGEARDVEDIAIYAVDAEGVPSTLPGTGSFDARSSVRQLARAEAKDAHCYLWIDLRQQSLRRERWRLFQSALRLQQTERAASPEAGGGSSTSASVAARPPWSHPEAETSTRARSLSATEGAAAAAAALPLASNMKSDLPTPDERNTTSPTDGSMEPTSNRRQHLPPRALSLATTMSVMPTGASSANVFPELPQVAPLYHHRRGYQLGPLSTAHLGTAPRLPRSGTELADLLAAYGAANMEGMEALGLTSSPTSTPPALSSRVPREFGPSLGSTEAENAAVPSTATASDHEADQEHLLERDADLMARQHFF